MLGMSDLSTRQERFCQEYASGASGAEAARRAGYSPHGADAREWYGDPKTTPDDETDTVDREILVSAEEALMAGGKIGHA